MITISNSRDVTSVEGSYTDIKQAIYLRIFPVMDDSNGNRQMPVVGALSISNCVY